jgi:hypothetical protein
MPPRRPKGPEPGKWQYQVGEVPHLLTAYERPDKANAIYTRVWDGRRYRSKKALCGPIRDERGRVDPEREIVAQQLAMRRQSELAANVEPDEARGGPLTLAGGFRKVLDRSTGKFPSDTGHRREVVRASVLIGKVIGRDRRMDGIKHRDYRALWRHIAHEHKRTGKMGLRTAEIYCGVLQNAARWLQHEGYLEPGEGVPAPGWKQAMRSEWETITESPAPKPEKLRYTDAESVKLWRALPSADPRIALAMELGAELRIGQVARVRRSDVLPSPGWRFGMLHVHGRGKKFGETIVLTASQRHALTQALLWGYLAEPEAARRAGEITDYYLFGGGRLHRTTDHRGRKVRRLRKDGAAKPITRRAFARQWERLEGAAGVDHQRGRLWYGMRRLQADKADALMDVDARVKNRMGGWSRTSTREGYLEGAKIEDAVEAAAARKRIRPKGIREQAGRTTE